MTDDQSLEHLINWSYLEDWGQQKPNKSKVFEL